MQAQSTTDREIIERVRQELRELTKTPQRELAAYDHKRIYRALLMLLDGKADHINW